MVYRVYRSYLQAAVVALCLVVALSGCSSSSFLGRQYNNFTAYYNGFYNAKQAFREGREAVERSEQSIDRDTYLSLFPRAQTSSNQSFDEAIKKSADLLRNHPQSKWVDQALLLIGKSYYYEENYVGSEQKFREVMSLDSPLEDEARFWLARTMMAGGDYTEAIDLIRERLAELEEVGEWTAKMQLVLGELFVHQEEWEQAAGLLEQGLRVVDDKRLGARGQFLLGQVYETLNEYDRAAQAYRDVANFNPLYELSYAASVSYARVIGLNGDPQRALRMLASMQRDDKHFEKRGELALMRARVLQAAGQIYDARDLYETILYGDDEFLGQDVQSRVQYRLAELYRDELNAYPMAAAYFDSAATGTGRSAPQGEEELRYTPDAIVNVSEQAEQYQQFTTQIQEINRLDSLLHLGSLDQAAFDSVITRIRVQRAEEARREVERRRQQEARQNFQSRSQSTSSDRNRNNRGSGTQSAVEAAESGDAGFLFHDDPVQLQQSRAAFQMTWGERPLAPNWRRREAIRGQSDDGSSLAGSEDGLPTSREEQEAAMLPPVNTSDVPRDSAAQAEMQDRRAEMWYRLGNTLFLQLNQPDSAATWYRKVITDNEERPVAQRAYYALSEVYRAEGDMQNARRLYREIIDKYPSSSFARRARTYLEGIDGNQSVGVDSLQQARSAYAEAYRAWQDEKDYGEAVDRMLAVARTFKSTQIAPRALLAAGYIYLEWADKDSLNPHSAIPLQEPSLCCGSINGLAEFQPTLEEGQANTNALPDSLFTQPVYLENLYASLEDSYPGTPHADRARRIRESVNSLSRSSSADDSLTAPADTADVSNAPERSAGTGQDVSGEEDSSTPPDDPADASEQRSEDVSSDGNNPRAPEIPADSSATDREPDRDPPSETVGDTTTVRDTLPDIEP